MKTKLVTIVLGCALAGSSTLPALDYSFSPPRSLKILTAVEVVNIRDVDSATLYGIMEGKCPHLALEISQGEVLPLKLFLAGDFVELVEPLPELTIITKRDLYFRHAEGDFFYSTNGDTWHIFADFFTGKAMVSLGLEEPGRPQATLGVELYERASDQ